MTLEIILRYLHFISVFTILEALVSEQLLLKSKLYRLKKPITGAMGLGFSNVKVF